ncbi:MAG TPA: zinc ribbon domain-containing protein [Candidatus Sulfotelmatobacter sp.]|nr:zinc ribbon domain-containing protein [Candidatus Sulfotelmatobacter sp.]
MFCNQCGTEMRPGFGACPKCGRRMGDPVGRVAYSRLERHLHTLGILWMAIGALFLVPAAGLLVFGGSAHFVLHDREPLAGLFPLLVYIGGGSLLLLGAGGVCVGLGLQERQPWARVAAIVLGVLALFHPPFGTALGVYTLWVLLADEQGEEYRHLSGTS